MKSEFLTQKNEKYLLAKSISGAARTFARLNSSGFLICGTFKALVYSLVIENEQTLHQRVLRPLRPIAAAPGPTKLCDIPRSDVSVCIDWGGGYFEHSL